MELRNGDDHTADDCQFPDLSLCFFDFYSGHKHENSFYGSSIRSGLTRWRSSFRVSIQPKSSRHIGHLEDLRIGEVANAFVPGSPIGPTRGGQLRCMLP
jgi:hypothetical protein